MSLEKVLEQVKLGITGGNFSLTAPLWVLVFVIAWFALKTEARISKIEQQSQWTEMVLRSKFPKTTHMVDRIFNDYVDDELMPYENIP